MSHLTSHVDTRIRLQAAAGKWKALRDAEVHMGVAEEMPKGIHVCVRQRYHNIESACQPATKYGTSYHALEGCKICSLRSGLKMACKPVCLQVVGGDDSFQ